MSCRLRHRAFTADPLPGHTDRPTVPAPDHPHPYQPLRMAIDTAIDYESLWQKQVGTKIPAVVTGKGGKGYVYLRLEYPFVRAIASLF